MGPPIKRLSKASKRASQKKLKTNNASKNPTAGWMEHGKTEPNIIECAVKVEPEDESDPNEINEEASGLESTFCLKDSGVQCSSPEMYHNIKDEQEEGNISHETNGECGSRSVSPSIMGKPQDPLEEQKWMLEDYDDNQSFTTDKDDRNVKLYSCFCGKSYSSSSHLNRHRKIHGSKDQLPEDHYKNVTSAEDDTKQIFICHCDKQYTSRSNLKRHQKSCNDQALVNTTESVAITYHKVEDQEEKLRPYVCACGKSYTSLSHLYRHQRSHLETKSQTEKRFICECGKTYGCTSHLYRHQKIHKEERLLLGQDDGEDPEELEKKVKPYVCFCGKRYTCSSHLYRHQKVHQEENSPPREKDKQEPLDKKMEKRYKCECGKRYTSRSHLYRHQRKHKEEDFKSESNDFGHDSEVDLEDCRQKPFRCECGKSFILSFSLLLHKKIHCQWKHTTDCTPLGH